MDASGLKRTRLVEVGLGLHFGLPAGGLIDGTTWSETKASDALRRADAGTYLEQCGGLFATGPTHTNVMDLVIVIIDQQKKDP